jgi:hypothetical protein
MADRSLRRRGAAANDAKNATLFDTTLRDGQQTPGIDFSLEDKVLVAGMLDALGHRTTSEGGYPGGQSDGHGVLLPHSAAEPGRHLRHSGW